MGPNQTIRQARGRLGLTPQELGDAVGIPHALAWDLEAYADELGQTLSLAELNRLCGVLHLSPPELFDQPSPERHVQPSEVRECVFEECRLRARTIEQFGEEIGWDVQGLIDAPDDYLSGLNWDGLQDICRSLGLNPLGAIPLPVAA